MDQLLPMYPNRPGVPYFHEQLNMPPSKAAGLLNKVAQSHSKGGKGKSTKGKSRGATRFPSDGRGARVFGGKK